ncbi:MAG TPA: response regulator, partial [Polyangiales bacterium]|nr:response regulator [Polyangiales bacterium]
LIELLNDILDLSKIEAGMLEAEVLRFAPDKLLREVVEDARLRANERGLSLELSVDGPLPQSIQSDPTRLRQILLNLLSNAIKFTEQGSVRVRTRLLPEACLLEICVSDTGIGIPEEIAQQLFEPFMQADTSITRRYGGTGLGLTITKQLVQLLGGEIGVHNEPEGGAVFVFTVATGPLDSVPLTTVDLESQHYTADKVSVQGAHVLVVDDRRDMRYLLQTFLEEAGAHVITAANGRDALTKAQEQTNLDAIVLDMQMPEMDGFAAAKHLRERGYRGKLIALTASAMTSDRERCIAAGCDEYMSKPVDRARLLELIAHSTEDSKKRAAESEQQRKRVLIVDDNEDASEVLSQLLMRGNDQLDVSTAASGNEALTQVRTLRPHVVILDLGLPDLDGYEVLARLRALPELLETSFIALTGRASSAEQARAMAAGFTHYFVKPADLEALRRAVRSAS